MTAGWHETKNAPDSQLNEKITSNLEAANECQLIKYSLLKIFSVDMRVNSPCCSCLVVDGFYCSVNGLQDFNFTHLTIKKTLLYSIYTLICSQLQIRLSLQSLVLTYILSYFSKITYTVCAH